VEALNYCTIFGYRSEMNYTSMRYEGRLVRFEFPILVKTSVGAMVMTDPGDGSRGSRGLGNPPEPCYLFRLKSRKRGAEKGWHTKGGTGCAFFNPQV
jgi:hypothetical protein